MESSKPFPIYQLLDAFEAFSHAEPDVKPQHRSLYYYLVGYARKRGNVVRYNMPYENGMHGSGIGSWATYDAALKALAAWGFIEYTPGANRYKVPVIGLTFRNPSDDQLLTYWQSYCISTANPTDDVLPTQLATYKDLLEVERKRVEELESQKTNERTEHERVRSAFEKKIEALEVEREGLQEAVRQAEHQASQLRASLLAQRPASHTGGAARPKDPIHFCSFSQCKFSTEQAFTELLGQLGYQSAYAPYYLAQIRLKTASLEDRTPEGWQNYINTFLHKDAQRGQLTTADPGQTTQYGTAAHFSGNNHQRQHRVSSRLDVEAAVSIAGALATGSAPAG